MISIQNLFIQNVLSQIRTYGMAMIVALLGSSIFVYLKLYPILVELIDLHGCFLILAIASIIGFFFILFVLKETSGKSLDDVGRDETRWKWIVVKCEFLQKLPLWFGWLLIVINNQMNENYLCMSWFIWNIFRDKIVYIWRICRHFK